MRPFRYQVTCLRKRKTVAPSQITHHQLHCCWHWASAEILWPHAERIAGAANSLTGNVVVIVVVVVHQCSLFHYRCHVMTTNTIKGVFGKATRLALLGACGYATYDALNDAAMYYLATRWLGERLNDRQDVKGQLGDDPEMGPWHDASVSFSHHGMVASINVPVRGSAKGGDAIIRAVRKGGLRSPLLHNATGGKWDIMAMDVLLGMHSNRMISVSLLDQPEESMSVEERARRARAMGEQG